uniref:ISXO2-like transposase domain-containing protein n=1 Tax=Candidatus Kentrum sp. FM TaxID=2126340 RepID=A0A450SHQ3_9GAMM|nr:MAG: ISXO2-like transposase domain-containing protein [Candidatus Kentron sp. FM]VFJ52769.1 MAG: ISXO2-like transposase domain-containing protein [Candidatus Kentron sp. FM]
MSTPFYPRKARKNTGREERFFNLSAAEPQQKTICPVITSTIAPGTLVYTDEYDIYDRLPEWGYGHKTVCHNLGLFEPEP